MCVLTQDSTDTRRSILHPWCSGPLHIPPRWSGTTPPERKTYNSYLLGIKAIPGVGNFDDGEGHYNFTFTPEGQNAYSQKHVKIADLQAQNASHCDAF